ncbi:MAG: HAD-IC family P-type ATPase [Dehalococcoidia bacterium]|nr:HAD-IC family P-type ATPase [Dehalococcoidia bacterium]
MNDSRQPRWHQLEVDEVLSRLQAGRQGLSPENAAERVGRFGYNELEVDERALPLEILLRQIQSPLIYILLAAGAVTAILRQYVDTGVIMAVVVLNSVVGFVQEYRAEQALRALAGMTAPKARVLRAGVELEIDPQEVVPGDAVLLESGVKVPADLRLFRTLELQADESVLTGESLPVAKTIDPIADPNAPLGDQGNMAFMGTIIVRGRGAGIAVATGMQTALGHISAQVRQVGEVKSPLQLRLSRFAQIIAILVIAVTALVFSLGLITEESLTTILLTAIATAVATVPEGLPVTITVALAVGAWRMAQRKAIIRKLPAVETLGSCTTICSDKTGTLTKNEMTVTRIYAAGQVFEVTGAGYAPEGYILLGGRRVSPYEYPALEMALRTGMLCNESSVYRDDGRYLADGDPTEAALIVAAMKGGLHREREEEDYPLLDEIPFESERQYMATLHGHACERLIFVKGAPERILEMCEGSYNGSVAPLDRLSVLQESYLLASEGLRLLAVAYKPAAPGSDEVDHRDVETGLLFVGLQGMMDPPRQEAIVAVDSCKRAGIRVVMLTGDHAVTAGAIARQMTISSDPNVEVIDGRELDAMDDEELYARVERVSVYARATPQHKLRIVQQLRRSGEVVAVTGDGVNDAPALKQADIGVAMGVVGTDVAKEAADMVLADDNFATIYAAVEEGRVVFENIRKVIMFLIPTGLGLVLTVIASMVLGLPLPFLPAQAIWINLVTNGLQDVAMAFEPAEEDVGRRQPRDPREGLLTRPMIERIVLTGLVVLAGTFAAFIWQLGSGNSLEHARTVAMTTMVLFQNFHVFNSRSFSRSIFQVNPLSNRFLFATIVAALGLHVLALYWGPLQFVLRTEPLGLGTWLAIVSIAATVVLAIEAEKYIRRSISRRHPPAARGYQTTPGVVRGK